MILVPDYYKDFCCIADNCKHTCCKDFEIEIDELSLERFLQDPFVSPKIELGDYPHIKLNSDESCPFLNDKGLCEMIINKGEDYLCQICRDHPRFRNYWTEIEEIGLGLVCEEAGRLILSQNKRLSIVSLDNTDFSIEDLPEDEKQLWALRENLINEIKEEGPFARLKEYFIFRHIPDALYDGLIEERIKFVSDSYREIIAEFEKTDKTFEDLVECARVWSFNTEYDDEVLNNKITDYLFK